MKKPPEVEDLLQEQRLISDDERAAILREIDDEFRSFLHHEESGPGYTVRSRGLLLPVTIGFAALLAALVVILISQGTLSRGYEGSIAAVNQTSYSSEWQILKLYLEESEELLRGKDAEIDFYRAEIRAYDERIRSLRELIRLKDETQNRLLDERRSLSGRGLDEEAISDRLAKMEREVIAGLSPEIAEFYDLSIEDINAQIDRLLNERESNESLLQDSLAEREQLADETTTIAQDIRTRESESWTSDEMRRTINQLNATISGYEQLGTSRSVFEAAYSEILAMIGNSDFESALEGVSRLEQLLEERSENQGAEAGYDLGLENQTVRLVREYIEFRISSDAAASPVSAPEATESVPADEPEPRIDNVPEPLLIGEIAAVEFNQLRILPVGSAPVEAGDEFMIYRNMESGDGVEIGSGIISSVSEDEYTGRLLSLVTLSNKPETGDAIMIRPR